MPWHLLSLPEVYLMCVGQDGQQALQAHIAPIKEVMPDFGDGFLAAALQHFSYNSEQVIHALLEGALPPELQALDPHMPLPNPSQQPLGGGKADSRDRGKGKLPQCTYRFWKALLQFCIHILIMCLIVTLVRPLLHLEDR